MRSPASPTEETVHKASPALSTCASLIIPSIVFLVGFRFWILHSKPGFNSVLFYLNIFSIPVLTIFGWFAGIRLRPWLKSFGARWNVLTCAFLYAQAVYLLFLLMTSGSPFIRVPLLIVTFLFLGMFAIRPSLTLILIYSAVYLVLFLDSLLYFYSNIHFDDVLVNSVSLVDFMAIPLFWLANVAIGIALATSKQIDHTKWLRSLRYTVGLSTILVILMFAHFYQTAAKLTRGDAFDYPENAITVQWKRELASLFPNLPKRVYTNLVTAHRDSKTDIWYGIFSDHLAGLTTYVPVGDEHDSIGDAWADFYAARIKQRKISQFRIVKLNSASATKESIYQILFYNKPTAPEEDDNPRPYPNFAPYSQNHPAPAFQAIVYFPRSMQYHPGLTPPEGGDLTVHLVQNSAVVVPDIYEGYLFDIRSLGLYLQHAGNYLDDAPKKVDEVFDKNYLDSFGDYVYFSVTTVTTTGYGDITAIDPQVRFMTMAEIVTGWVLLLLFGTLLMSGFNKS